MAAVAGLPVLAVIGVLTSVVGAFYYLRIVKIMYFDEPADAFDRRRARDRCDYGRHGSFHSAVAFTYDAEGPVRPQRSCLRPDRVTLSSPVRCVPLPDGYILHRFRRNRRDQ